MSQTFDIRQSRSYEFLDQISGAADTAGDTLMAAINEELTKPLRLTADPTPSTVVLVGPIVLTNPVPTQARNRTILPTVGLPLSFAGGTVTFPVALDGGGNGNITFSTGGSTQITLPVLLSRYTKVIITLNSAGQLGVVIGTPAISSAAASVPSPATSADGIYNIGFVEIYSSGGFISVITSDKIWQFDSAGGGGPTGAMKMRVNSTVTANYTVGGDDCLIPVDTTAGQVALSLPTATAAGKGRYLIIKDVGGAITSVGKAIVLQPAGGNFIDGVAGNMTLDYAPRMSVTLVCDGASGWMIV